MNFLNSFILVTLISANSFAGNRLGDFLKNSDGTIKTRVTLNEAFILCCMENGLSKNECKYNMSTIALSNLKIRLPTARELAIEATKYGAEILELSQVSPGNLPKGFTFKNVENLEKVDEEKDQFYYSNENYVKPAGGIGNYWIWSRSILIRDPYDLGQYAMFFSDFSGGIHAQQVHISDRQGADRCMDTSDVHH